MIQTKPKRIKVAFYSFFHGGGIGQYTHELLKSLHERPELSVQLYCPPNFYWLKDATYPVLPILFKLSSTYPLVRRIRFLLAQYISPTRFLRSTGKEQTNILHFSNINHLTYPFWQGKAEAIQARIVCTAHDVKRSKAILQRRYETEQLKSFYRDCQRIFVHSKSQGEELREFADISNEAICQIPHGPYSFDVHGTFSRRSPEANLFSSGLFFGNIRDEKNLDGLLYALAKTSQNIRLVIAGRPAGAGHRPIDYYKQLAQRLDINHRIDWHIGFIPENEVAHLFNQCDWVALPYLPEFSSQSGVFNIATHFHKPILASPAPTFSELLKVYPIGVLAHDLFPTSISLAMDKIAVKSKKPDQFQFEAYLKNHTWERNAELTTKAYLDLLGNSLIP